MRGAEYVELFDQKREIEVLGASFEVSRFLFGMFRAAPIKSETTIVNQLLILFHKCGLRFYWKLSEHYPTTPATTSSYFTLCLQGTATLFDGQMSKSRPEHSSDHHRAGTSLPPLSLNPIHDGHSPRHSHRATLPVPAPREHGRPNTRLRHSYAASQPCTPGSAPTSAPRALGEPAVAWWRRQRAGAGGGGRPRAQGSGALPRPRAEGGRHEPHVSSRDFLRFR